MGREGLPQGIGRGYEIREDGGILGGFCRGDKKLGDVEPKLENT